MIQTDFQAITLSALLDAKERRSQQQQTLLQRYKKPLISFTINYPGAIKYNQEVQQFFKLGCEAILEQFKATPLLFEQQEQLATGATAFFIYDIEAQELKERCIQLEQSNQPWRRLWDIDVFDPNTTKALSRTEFAHAPRKCLICEQNAKECARSKAHSLFEIQTVITQYYQLSLNESKKQI